MPLRRAAADGGENAAAGHPDILPRAAPDHGRRTGDTRPLGGQPPSRPIAVVPCKKTVALKAAADWLSENLSCRNVGSHP